MSAIQDVESTGIEVLRVEPDDIVNASEIARRVSKTRESIRKYIAGERGSGTFPSPISGVRRGYQLWRWSEVAKWFVTAGDENVATERLRRMYHFYSEYCAHCSAIREQWYANA